MTVEKLADVNKRPNPEVVEVLEQALELAKSGELRDVAIMGVLTENKIFTGNTQYDAPLLIGTLELIKYSMLKELDDNKTLA